MNEDPIEALLAALEVQESSGNPRARNRRTGAYGRYQIIPSNWKAWSKEVFGEEVEPTPENQERVARHKLNEYVERFGIDGALVAWYGGPGRAREWVRNPDNPWFDRRHGDGDEPSVREYVDSVMSRIQDSPDRTPAPVSPPLPEADRRRLAARSSMIAAPDATRVATRPAPTPPPPAAARPSPTPSFAARRSPMAPADATRVDTRPAPLPDEPAPLPPPSTPELSAAAAPSPTTFAVRPFRTTPPELPTPERPTVARRDRRVQETPSGGGMPTEEDVLRFLGSGDEQALPSEDDVRSFLRGGDGGEPSPRERGRQSAEGIGFIGAAGQGVGSGLFGIGTPLTAMEAMIGSRLMPGEEPLSWDEALEYARGRREGAWEEAPVAYGLGFGGSMVGGVTAGAKALARAPKAVQALLRPTRAAADATRRQRAANTAANLARLSGTGAAAAGTTAALEEGLDAAPGAAVVGGVGAPALVVGGGRALSAAKGAKDFLGDNRTLRTIANRLMVPVEVLEGNLARWNRAFPDRAPRLAEILDPRSAEEIALIAQGGTGARAGRVFRETAEEAGVSRQTEVAEAVRRGGPTTSVEAETNHLAPIQREAAEETGRRVQTSEAAVSGRATARYNEVMGQIGKHEVPVTEEMLEQLMHPDVQGGIPTILRRRLNQQLEAGAEAGSITLPMDMWDMLRKELGRRAGQPGASQLYSELRQNVTDYVSERVPEYRRLLDEYGRRSEVAAGVTAGRAALTQDTKEFVDMLRTSGGGAPDRPLRPRTEAMTRVGARIGARTNFANLMRRNPEQTMERLARDEGLQANLRAVLQPEEWRRLEELADRYGYQLRRVEGARVGARGVNVGSGSSEGFAAEAAGVRGATVPGRAADAAEDAVFFEYTAEGAPLSSRPLSNPGGRPAPAPGSNTYREVLTRSTKGDKPWRISQLRNDEPVFHEEFSSYREAREALDRMASERGADVQLIPGAPRRPTTPRPAPEGGEALEQAGRGMVADAASRSPQTAAAVAEGLAKHEGLRQRLVTAFGGEEAARLSEVGEAATLARRNLQTLSPPSTEAAQRAQAMAQDVQTLIGALVITTGRASGAMQASVGQRLIQRFSMTQRGAERAAQLLVDPEQAPRIIAYLKARGASAADIHKLYMESAAAAGITIGSQAQGRREPAGAGGGY